MKKIILIVLFLAGAARAAFFYYSMRYFSAPVSGSDYYAEYLPANTLAVFTLMDLRDIAEAFPKSAAGKFMAKPTMHGIMAEQGATAEQQEKYDEFYDGIADLLTNPFLQQLFGDDVTFALLPPDPAHLFKKFEEEQKNKLIAFGSSAAARSVDSLARLTMSGDFSKVTAAGLELTRIRLDNDEFLYGYTKHGVIILAFRPELIAAALQQKAAGGSLRENSFFAAAKKFWSESAAADQWFFQSYLNLAQLKALIAGLERKEAQKAVAYLQGFTSASSVAVAHQGDFKIISKVEYVFTELNKDMQKQQERLRTNKNSTLPLLTEKTLFYSWFSGVGETMFSAVDPLSYKAADAAAQQEIGLSIKEMMAAVGPQVGLVVNEVVNAGLFPLPKMVLFIQIQQPAVARQIVDKLRQKFLEQGIRSEQVAAVNGRPIYYWNLLPVEAAHPALALTEAMLYLANGESTLKNLLNQSNNEMPQAMRETLGAELAGQIATANSAAFVVRPAPLSPELQKIADWLVTAFSASVSTSAETLRAEMLTMMKSLHLIAGYSQIEKDHALSVLVFRKNAVQ